jgi:hypothetical protein
MVIKSTKAVPVKIMSSEVVPSEKMAPIVIKSPYKAKVIIIAPSARISHCAWSERQSHGHYQSKQAKE